MSWDERLEGYFSPAYQALSQQSNCDGRLAQFGIPASASFLKQCQFLRDTKMMPHGRDGKVFIPKGGHDCYTCKVMSDDQLRIGDQVVLMPPLIEPKQLHSHHHFPMLMKRTTAENKIHRMLVEDLTSILQGDGGAEPGPAHKASEMFRAADHGNMAVRLFNTALCFKVFNQTIARPMIDWITRNSDQLDQVTVHEYSEVAGNMENDAFDTNNVNVAGMVKTCLRGIADLNYMISPKVIGVVECLLDGSLDRDYATNGDYVRIRIFP